VADAGAVATPRAAARSARVGTDAGGSGGAVTQRSRADHAAASRAGTPSQADVPTAANAEVLSVLSFSAAGMTLLLAQRPTGREARLVRDLFAAVSGRWDIDPVSRAFDWPPAVAIPGADGPGAADRALRAFVEKELADHGSALMLVEQALAARLRTLRFVGEQIAIPDLARLGRDSQEKRRLWAVLGRRASTPVRSPGEEADSSIPPEAEPRGGDRA